MGKKCQIRFVIGVLIFWSTFVTYMIRVAPSITTVDMLVPQTKGNGTVVVGECIEGREKSNKTHAPIDMSDRLKWSQGDLGWFLSIYFGGAMVSSAFAGMIAETVGPTLTIAVTSLLAGFLSLVFPLLAKYSTLGCHANRLVVGICSGCTYPSCQVLIARWARPEEKGTFTALMLSGGTLATVITWPVLGIIVGNYGWSWGFYTPGLVTLFWGIFFLAFVRDFPERHKMISQAEIELIKEAQGGTVTNKKKIVPYKKIFSSLAVWAYIIAQFGNLWGLLLWAALLPKFEADALGFDVKKSGLVGALPNTLRMILGFVFGSFGDYLVKSGKITKLFARKFFLIFSHFLPALFLILVTPMGCNSTLVMLLIVISSGLNGSVCLTHLQNAQDLCPNYAGTVYGLGNAVGGLPGLITSRLAMWIIGDSNKIIRWHISFWIGAAVYIACGLVFLFWGKVEVQPWNTPPENPETAGPSSADDKQKLKDEKKQAKAEAKEQKRKEKEEKAKEKEEKAKEKA